MALRWRSNSGLVADRSFTISKVEGGKPYMMVDPSEGRWVEVYDDLHPDPTPAAEVQPIRTSNLPEFASPVDFTRPGDGIRSEAVYDRHEIDGMIPEDAVAYLLEQIELMTQMRVARTAVLIDAAGKNEAGKNYLDKATAQTFLILWDGSGRTLTHEYIAARMEQQRGVFFDSTGIASRVKRLRATIEALEWPIEIETTVGIGYRMEHPSEWMVPWDDPKLDSASDI